MTLQKPYAVLTVYVNLDAVPGVFSTADSARESVEAILRNNIPHYDPRVYVANGSLALDNLNYE